MKPLLANSGVLYVTWIALVSELTITSIHAVPRIHFDNYRCVAQRRKRGFNLLQLKSISKGDRGKFTPKKSSSFSAQSPPAAYRIVGPPTSGLNGTRC
jgi:hypothetical protein